MIKRTNILRNTSLILQNIIIISWPWIKKRFNEGQRGGPGMKADWLNPQNPRFYTEAVTNKEIRTSLGQPL